MADTQERIEVLKKKHLPASVLIKAVMEEQARQIGILLADTGVYMGGRVVGGKVVASGKDWYECKVLVAPWSGGEAREHGKIVFGRVRQGGAAILERELPYETDRETQEALSMTLSNRGDTDIHREVTREVNVGTVDTKVKADTIHWDVEVSAEATVGVEGTASNWGATATATVGFSAGVGGEHSKETSNETSEDITRGVSDSFDVPAKTKVKIVGTYDKISLRQDYSIWYPLEYSVDIHIGDFGISKWETFGKWYWSGDTTKLKFDGIDALISAYLGYPMANDNPGFSDNIGKLAEESWIALSCLEHISSRENRMVRQRGTVTYADASDISVDVYKVGEYNEKGELK